jgi:hypothetical protein
LIVAVLTVPERLDRTAKTATIIGARGRRDAAGWRLAGARLQPSDELLVLAFLPHRQVTEEGELELALLRVLGVGRGGDRV